PPPKLLDGHQLYLAYHFSCTKKRFSRKTVSFSLTSQSGGGRKSIATSKQQLTFHRSDQPFDNFMRQYYQYASKIEIPKLRRRSTETYLPTGL
ncbi:MAG: hypothetical protein ACK53Y_01250, partial [bacterium]